MAQSKPMAQGAGITERKQTEKALSRKKNFSDAVMNSLPGLLFVFDDKGNTMQWNRNVEKVTGYSAKEISKMNVLDFVAKEDQKTAAEAMQEVLTKGQASLEINVLSKPGKKTPFHIKGLRTKIENAICVVCTGIDVTERKQTEKALQDSEGRFMKLAEQSPNMIFINQKGRVVYANSICQTFTGYTKEELHSPDFNFFSLIAPESSELVKANFNRHMKGESVTPYEFTLLKKGGKKGEVILATALMEYEGSVAILGVLTDITERKRAEEALGESEERYRTLFESAAQGILIVDTETMKFKYANPAVCTMLGYSQEELIKMGVGDIHPKTSLEDVLAEFAAQARGEKILSTLPCLKKDGTIVYANINAAKAIIDGRKCNIGFFTDVTERKLAEEKLLQSEKRYRTIIESIEDGYFEVDLAGTFTFVNDAQCRMTGSPRERLIGRNNRAYTTEEEAKKIYQLFSGIYKTGKPVTGFAFEYKRKDGTMAFNEMSASLIRDSEGKPIGFRGISRDVTERKRVEHQLSKRMNELRAFYSLAEITEREGISLDKLYQEFANILPQSWQYPEIACARIMIGDSEFCTENFAESPWKQSAPVKVHASVVGRIEVGYLEERPEEDEGPFLKEERLLIGAIAERIGHVTERKRAAEQLQRYAADLERNNEEVKNFAYIVSHDLRVPLVNLKGYTSELRTALEVIGSNLDAALPHLIDEKRSAVATALHEDVPEALEFITSSVVRMDSFINAVLVLSRLGRQDLKPESLDMNALVQATVETMSHQLQERRIEVIVGSLPQVVADRTAMEQITGNILGNAVKYLDSSRSGRIEVTAQANGAETTFRIRDNGRGIAAEDMDKVFAPFRRAGKQDTPGEGMGLAYVQTLVRRHGGRISCESEPGKGTTFTFTISTRSEKGAPDA